VAPKNDGHLGYTDTLNASDDNQSFSAQQIDELDNSISGFLSKFKNWFDLGHVLPN